MQTPLTAPACPTLSEARASLAKGELKPSELTALSLARIAATEPLLHTAVTVCAEEAHAQAAALDALAGTPEAEAMPLFGIPLSIKDVICTQGIRTTCASKMLENFIPPYDAFVIRQLKKAGAVIVAKTNLDEFAMGSSTEYSAFGATSNPWDTKKVPGGSSGGSAASIAAGQVCGSLGTDTGGSIRQPASFCGCCGIKPTYGRVSRYGAVAYASSFDQIGPMAATVEDCARLLDVIAGYDPQDATSANIATPSFSSALTRTDLKGITLGMPKEFWDQGLSSEVHTACTNAVTMAKDLGATVIETSLPHLEYSVAAYYILTAAEASTNLARFDGVRYGLRAGAEEGLAGMYTASRSLGFGEEVKRRILFGAYVLSAGYYDAYYKKASQVRRLITQDYENALTSCDALIAPVCPMTAWERGAFVGDPLTTYKMDILTLSLNLAGLPGLALPVGLGAETAMPVGIQLVGKAFAEADLLVIGNSMQRALPPLGTPRSLC